MNGECDTEDCDERATRIWTNGIDSYCEDCYTAYYLMEKVITEAICEWKRESRKT